MAKAVARYKWYAKQCESCGAWHNHYVYESRSKVLYCRVWWSRAKNPWAKAPFGNKPKATFRVVRKGDTFAKHPNPKWRPQDRDKKIPIKRCCGAKAKPKTYYFEEEEE